MADTENRFSFRSYLAKLQERGELATIAAPVADDDYGISACLSALHQGPALHFTAPDKTGMTVAGNLLNSIDRVALGLGLKRSQLPTAISDAISRPLKSALVDKGACQEVELEPDLGLLPIPRFFEHETGPYITAGCIVARDSVTGLGNLSYARLKPLGADKALIGIAPNHHLAVMARAAAARGEKLPIAITIGNSPAVLVAAALYLKLGDDEMEMAGALQGAPIEVVRCRTNDLLVPADCEIVIEGEIEISETVEEGPVSEYHGMYERYGAGNIVTIKRITQRRNAIFQVIEPGFHIEHLLIGGVAIAAGLEQHLKGFIPAVERVSVLNSGCGRLSAVVVLGPDHKPGDPQKAIMGALSAVNLIKQVTVVDNDIDPWDEFEVQYAIATRLRAERDIVVVPGVRTDRSEPMKLGGTITNYGFVATKRTTDREDWTPARAPASAYESAAPIIEAIRAGKRTI